MDDIAAGGLIGFREGGERDQTTVERVVESLRPVGFFRIADIGDAGVVVFTFKPEGGRRHAPPTQGQFSAFDRISDNWPEAIAADKLEEGQVDR